MGGGATHRIQCVLLQLLVGGHHVHAALGAAAGLQWTTGGTMEGGRERKEAREVVRSSAADRTLAMTGARTWVPGTCFSVESTSAT